MTTYNIKMTGSTANITQALAGLVERQNTAFNLGYPDLKIHDLDWATKPMGMSEVTGSLSIGGKFRKIDIQVFREEFGVAVTLRKMELVND